MKYLKKFPNHEGYSAYSASTVYLTPNVSLCDQEDEVHYGSNSEPPTPSTNAITYTASSKLDVDLTAFTPAATAETFADGVGNIEFAENVTEIGSAAFMSNGKLLSIELPNSVTSIGEAAFYQCTNLTSIDIPSSVTIIDEYAFYKCNSLTSIDIPDSVTSIGRYVFSQCTSLTSITIPNSVTSIGFQALSGCTSLTSIDIPDSVTSIGDAAFRNCTSLTSIAIPSGVTTIGSSIFYQCTSLTSIDIPSSVTSIGRNAFQNCSSLTSVDIPDGVTSIGESAFQQCNRLTSVTCEATTPPSLGGYAFESTNDCPIYVPCESVNAYKSAWSDYADRIQCAPQPVTATITYTAANKLNVDLTAFTPAATEETYDTATHTGVISFNGPVTAIGDRAFVSKNALISIVIPDSVTSIGPVAFAGCSGMTSCTIGSGVRSIGDSAFGDCRRLESAIIPNGVTSIGNFVFGNCFSLTSVTIPDSVTTIGPSAFGSCRNLTRIDIPDGVTSIGNMAFYECFSLTSINIPTGITSIDNYVFQNCTSLLSVDIPSGVTSIGHSALNGCTSLTSITVNRTTPPTLGDYVFDNTNNCPIYVPCESVNDYKRDWSNYEDRIQCVTPPQPATPITYTAENKLNVNLAKFMPKAIDETYDATTKTGVISFNEPVTYIDYNAFDGCTGLTSIDIPDSVTSISFQAFYGCSSLTSVTLGNGLTIIGGLAFCNCYSLTSIVIPSSVTSIGDDTFNGCTSLTSVTVNATTPATLGKDAFIYTNNCPIYVPCESVEAYKSAENWSDYEDRIQCPPQPVTATITYTAANKLNVALSAFTPAAISEDYDSATQTGVIGFTEPVTEIGVNAFGVKYDLMSIELPNSVTTIGNGAFGGCTGLTSATIGNGVTSIGGSAFMNCPSLTSIDIPSGVTSIGNWAFSDCTSLTSIACEATTPPTLGNNAFANTNDCPIYVPCESVNSYKSAWSTYSTRIQCVTPPAPTTAITYTADNQIDVTSSDFMPEATGHSFNDGVGTIEFPLPVRDIYDHAFSGRSIKSINIPDSVTSIGYYVFDSCDSLTSATIGNGVTSIGDGTFRSCTSLTSIVIPSGVTTIGEQAFNYCSSLASIVIPDNVTSIGESAFYGCGRLASVTIGSGITSIKEEAFNSCYDLESVTVNATEPPTLGVDVFESTNDCPIYVPSGSVNAYKEAENWSNYADRIYPIS